MSPIEIYVARLIGISERFDTVMARRVATEVNGNAIKRLINDWMWYRTDHRECANLVFFQMLSFDYCLGHITPAEFGDALCGC